MSKRKLKQSEVAAIEALKKKIKTSTHHGKMQEAAEYYNQLGNQYRLLGKFEEALDAHQEEANISKRYNKNDKMALGIAYRNLGEVLNDMKNASEAISYIRMYLKIARDEGNFVEQQRALITLGRAYLSMSEKEEGTEGNENSKLQLSSSTALEKSFQNFREAYKLLNEDELKDQLNSETELMLMKCNNCQNIGLTLELQGKLGDAMLWLKRAIDIGNKYQFHENLAPCYTVLCGLLLKENNRTDALNAAKNATKAARKLGNLTLEVEALLLEAKVMFMNDEVDAGKKLLKRLRQKIRKKQELHAFFEELDSLLIAAVRITRTQDLLFMTDESNAETKMKLYEVLADNYTALTNYERAINYYKKASKFAEKLGVNGKKLSRLYFSVAETYCDMENYDEAHNFYIQEMHLHSGNPEEEFKTQTNIAVVLEKLQKTPEEVIEAHELAVSLAKMTKSAIKEITALNNLSLYLESIGRNVDAVRVKDQANEIKCKNNITDIDETEPDSQDLLADEDEIDLDNLSEEEDSDDEVDDDKKTVKRLKTRVNEAGETQLHIAAKHGDLRQVRRLIRQGHGIKVKDNAGWTPLHEACNFGFTTVVEELLKHGADVNDAGGAMVEKISPLHDAASNGHCEVMKVLIKYGANVIARDAGGKYPIDSLLAWRESDNGKSCSEVELIAYREVKEILKEHMTKAGKPYRAEDEKRSRIKARARKSRSRSPKQSVLLVTKPYDEDCPILAKTVVDDYDPDKEGNGEEFYKSAIKHIGRKPTENHGSRKEKSRPISPGPRGALIPSDKDFHQKHTDWLLPDDETVPLESTSKRHQTSKPKRKRDSMEDVILDERSTRRKTGSSSSRQKDRDEKSIPPARKFGSDDEDELMDIESPNAKSPSSDTVSRNSDPVGIEENILNDNFVEEDFSELLGNDVDLDLSSIPYDDNEEFLPSQRPAASTVEFGRVVDIPVADDSDGDEVDIGDRARRSKNVTKPHRPITISSDDEDNSFQNVSRSKRNLKYSDISTVLKQANSKNLGSKSSRNEKSLIQTRLPVKILPRTPSRNSDYEDTSPGSSPTIGNPSNNTTRRISSSALPNTTNVVDDRQKKAALLLKIRILDKVLLVPVKDAEINESIDWLAKASAERYLTSYGVKPVLSLQTKDGASLSGADPISLVLEANERELDGIVTNFDLPPLIERYCTACSQAAMKVDPEVKSSLSNCQSSNILTLCDEDLRGKSAGVLMTALQRQNSLRILTLSGCSLFDSGVLELCKTLPTLSGLTELDLSSNGITKVGFVAFAEVFLKENQPSESVLSFCSLPVGLTKLVWNHNSLGNHIAKSLTGLLNKLSSLRSLEISDCDLSDKLFLGGTQNELSKAFNNSRLEELDISYNNFKDIGLEKCLQSLPARRIRSLNCSSCVPSNNSPTRNSVAKAVGTFLSGNEDCCNLASLKLNDCGLNDKSMDLILDNFDRLVRLERLELACNDSLTTLSLVNILERSVDRDIPLTNLDMGSIPRLWNTTRVSNEQVLHAVTKKLNSQTKLSELRVPISDGECESSIAMEEGSQMELSKLERNMVELMSDYAGSSNFHYEKHGTCIIYRLED